MLTAALGIGANTALFSVVRAVLLRPLGYSDPQRLVVLTRGATPIHVDEFRAAARSYSGIGVFISSPEAMALTGSAHPEMISAARVSSNFLDILGVAPVLGRGFLPAEDRLGGANVALLSTRLWRLRFGGDPTIVGRAITLAGTPYTVVGVLPPNFAFPFAGADLWITRPIEWSMMDLRSGPLSPYLNLVGRLRTDVTLAQARAELVVLNRQYAAAHPAMLDARPDSAEDPTRVEPLRQSVVADVRTPLLLLSGAVALLLLIVCANIATLLLARAATRAREFALRAALGAGRIRLLRQLLTESTLLSMLGGALGLLLAWLALLGIRSQTAFQLPRSSEIALDPGVLAFALALSFLTGILFGLAPALAAFRPDLAAALQGTFTGNLTRATGRRRSFAGGPRGLLVAGQIALSLILLVGAGLLLKTLAQLYRVDPGFRPGNVLTLSLALAPAQYDTPAKRADFYRRLVERIEAMPGIADASLTLTLPTTGWAGAPIRIAGRPEPPLNRRPIAILQPVSPDYFRTLQIRSSAAAPSPRRTTPQRPASSSSMKAWPAASGRSTRPAKTRSASTSTSAPTSSRSRSSASPGMSARKDATLRPPPATMCPTRSSRRRPPSLCCALRAIPPPSPKPFAARCSRSTATSPSPACAPSPPYLTPRRSSADCSSACSRSSPPPPPCSPSSGSTASSLTRW